MVKINGNEIRPGHVLEHQGQLWSVARVNSVKPGKGGAFSQVEMKNLRSGAKLNERFRSSEMVERVRLEQKTFQYLFGDSESCTFMDTQSFEQVELSAGFVGDKATWLQDGLEVVIEFHEQTPLHLSLPDSVTVVIGQTEPVVKGQTAASSFKPAVCDNGARVMVPPFVGQGDRIVVDTAKGAYLKRAE